LPKSRLFYKLFNGSRNIFDNMITYLKLYMEVERSGALIPGSGA
jgi:hypothetical protein